MSVTKPSPFAEVVNPEIPEFCATKVKKERVAKSRKAKTDDPSQNKLFPSADSGSTIDSGTEGIVEKEIIPVQTALNFPTESRKRARKTAKHDFSFSVEGNSISVMMMMMISALRR